MGGGGLGQLVTESADNTESLRVRVINPSIDTYLLYGNQLKEVIMSSPWI